jgi:ATP-dependent Lhr-like helicase
VPWTGLGSRVGDRPLGPAEGCAEGVGRIGRSEGDGDLLLSRLAERPQSVDRAGRSELGSAQPGDEVAAPASAAILELAQHLVRRGALGRLTVEKADGEQLLGRGDTGSPLRQALADAGFVTTPRGLRIRA